MYRGLVPESITAGMLEVACQRPLDAAALIDIEALEALGIARNVNQPQALVCITFQSKSCYC